MQAKYLMRNEDYISLLNPLSLEKNYHWIFGKVHICHEQINVKITIFDNFWITFNCSCNPL